MIRTVTLVFAVFCVATVLSEALGLGILWYRGQLSPEALKEIRVALTGENDDEFDADEDEQDRQPSLDDVLERRSLAVLELNTRQSELEVLKAMIDSSKSELQSEVEAFQKTKADFEAQLAALREQLTSEATEQARGILAALAPADAVGNLVQLSLEEDVLLLKGMPEKQIARILQEFASGPAQTSERGRQIFEALSQGEPTKTVTDDIGRDDARTAATPAT